MTQRQIVILPNGQEIDAPVGVSKEEIKDKAIRNGLISADAFKTQEPTPTVEQEDLPFYKDIYNYVKANMDLPLGLAGALKGQQVLGAFGPAGRIVGGIGGGAFGTFGGSLASDVITDKEELDFNSAVDKALMSIGFDIATLGAWRVAKPAFVAAKKALGFTPKEVAEQITAIPKQGFEAGSPESLQATQQILEEGGASLSRFQTGQASALEVFAEKLGEAGLGSGKIALENADKVNKATQKALNDVTASSVIRTGASPKELGSAVLDVVTAGRMALSDAYGDGLEQLGKDITNKKVNTGSIKQQLLKFQNQNKVLTEDVVEVVDEATGKLVEKTVSKKTSSLHPKTDDFINEQLGGVFEYGNMSAKALLDVDKMMTQRMKEFGDINSKNYNATVHNELGELQSMIKQGILKSLSQADAKAAEKYALLKKDYSEGMKGLLPEINKNVIKNAEKGNYDVLGNLLTTQTNVSKISSMFKSVDNAYRQLAKAKQLPDEIPYATAKEAKQAIRQSFIKNLVPDINSADFDISKYADLAARFSKPKEQSRLKAIMGEDYGRVRQLFNVMAEASKKPEGNLGTLFLRNKEYQSLTSVLQTGALGAVGVFTTGPVAIATALAVIGTPMFMAKAAFNPKAVNRLLAFNKAKFKSDDAREKAALLIVSDVMDALSDEEQAEIRNQFRPQ
jgi:hypothetical protein